MRQSHPPDLRILLHSARDGDLIEPLCLSTVLMHHFFTLTHDTDHNFIKWFLVLLRRASGEFIEYKRLTSAGNSIEI
jgi:hypothetical protein